MTVCRECGTPIFVAKAAPLKNAALFPNKLFAVMAAVGLLLILASLNVPATRHFDGVEIKGTKEFQEQVSNALALLRERASPAYEIVTNHVRIIKQSRRSGMRSELAKPTFELANPTAYYSLTWCASAIAHDSMHVMLSHNNQKSHSGAHPTHDWNSQVKEEKQCNAHQLQVLRAIRAPSHEIDHCAAQDGTHADVNKDGKYDWDDYEKGNW